MTTLAEMRCEACTKGTPTLTADELGTARGELSSDWEISGDRLHRRIATRQFADAFALATNVALIAQAEDHHPDLRVGWGFLEIDLTTHVAGGVTRNDAILAAKIDRVASR